MMTGKAFAIPFAAVALIAAAPAPSSAADNNEGGGTAVSSAASKPAKERPTCKVFTETGSHARQTRLCLTRAQWRTFEEQQRNEF
jgi:hypothetical protein